jgi:pyridoxine 5-phosphate synthase
LPQRYEYSATIRTGIRPEISPCQTTLLFMTRLSVNINKIATLRNSRGGNNPNVVKVALDCEQFGAEGITVHPRPDERHIRYQDVYDLKEVVTTEFNIEGNPSERKFVDLVLATLPAQVTLVPDALGAITSNAGWDTLTHKDRLTDLIAEFKAAGIRVSVFVDADERMVEGAKACGADRVELYTEPYAEHYFTDRAKAVAPFVKAAETAREVGLGLNAGHDLSLDNLRYLRQSIPWLDEVSIGHALISDALYFGLENTIQMYLRELE